MHSLDDLENMILDGKRYEAEGKFLLAYQIYKYIERVIDEDDDSYPFAGINPAPFDDAQYSARIRCGRLWYRLSEEEKRIVGNK